MACAALLVVGPASAHAEPPAAAVSAPSPAPRTTVVRDVSSAEGEAYRVWISVPPGAPPSAGFPVIYLLDGNAWFGVAAALAEARDQDYGRTVVVGVGYPVEARFDPRRLKELTPAAPLAPLGFGQDGLPVGGAEAFAAFLVTDVAAAVAGTVKVDRERQTLFGHSLGGLFVLHVLFSRPGAFDAYVAASPSIWWNPPATRKALAAARFGFRPPRVLITAGGLEGEVSESDRDWLRKAYAADPSGFGGKPLDDLDRDLRRKVAANRMLANARDMAAGLRRRGLDAHYVLFAGEDHNSVVPAALNRALDFAATTAATSRDNRRDKARQARPTRYAPAPRASGRGPRPPSPRTLGTRRRCSGRGR